MTPDRMTALRLLRDVPTGLNLLLKSLRDLEALPDQDLPDDVRAGILHMLPDWQSGAEHSLRVMEWIRTRIAGVAAQEATRRAIEGGGA